MIGFRVVERLWVYVLVAYEKMVSSKWYQGKGGNVVVFATAMV